MRSQLNLAQEQSIAKMRPWLGVVQVSHKTPSGDPDSYIIELMYSNAGELPAIGIRSVVGTSVYLADSELGIDQIFEKMVAELEKKLSDAKAASFPGARSFIRSAPLPAQQLEGATKSQCAIYCAFILEYRDVRPGIERLYKTRGLLASNAEGKAEIKDIDWFFARSEIE